MNRFGLLRKLIEGKELTFNEANTLEKTSPNSSFPFKYIIVEKLKEQGANAEIYLTKSKNPRIAKLGYEKTLLNGYKIQREFKKRGVKVANPRGMFRVYNPNLKRFFTAFVMEYAKGENLSKIELENPEFEIVQKKLEKEIKKMKKLGYKSYYARSKYLDESFFGLKLENILYDKATGRITLLDFDFDKLDTKKLYTNENGGKNR